MRGRLSKSEKPHALNLQLHTRVYLATYVRYLCRTKSHLCRSQNKLLIIEIRRISRRYVNGLHTLGEARRATVVVSTPFGSGRETQRILLCSTRLETSSSSSSSSCVAPSSNSSDYGFCRVHSYVRASIPDKTAV